MLWKCNTTNIVFIHHKSNKLTITNIKTKPNPNSKTASNRLPTLALTASPKPKKLLPAMHLVTLKITGHSVSLAFEWWRSFILLLSYCRAAIGMTSKQSYSSLSLFWYDSMSIDLTRVQCQIQCQIWASEWNYHRAQVKQCWDAFVYESWNCC